MSANGCPRAFRTHVRTTLPTIAKGSVLLFAFVAGNWLVYQQFVGPEGVPTRLGDSVPLLPWWHVHGAILLGVLLEGLIAILWAHLALRHYQHGVALAEAEAPADVFD
jgi:hypothetical protein